VLHHPKSPPRSALWLTAVVTLSAASATAADPQVWLPGANIPQFVQPLPTLGKGIAVVTGAQYTLSMCEFQANVLPPSTPLASHARGTTWVWGYIVGDTCPDKNTPISDAYIGPVVVAQRGVPTEVTYMNQLGDTASSHVRVYTTTVDQTIQWADPLNGEQNACAAAAMASPGEPPSPPCDVVFAGPIAAAPHLHGGEIPAMLDGGPDAWFTQGGHYGHGFYSKGGETDAAQGKAVYTYPNTQQPAPIWFHDHTLGATRLNVHAGLAGAYVITDPKPWNPNYPGNPLLPPITSAVPIVLQDRVFDTNGQFIFDNAGLNPDHPYWVPEFVGDTIVVNGKAWPYLNVQAKRYRFLFLDGSNARGYMLSFGPAGPPMWVIGNDDGYLDTPAKLDPRAATNNALFLLPGERYEVIIDFRGYEGRNLVLTNTAAAPYPSGDPVDPATTARIMQFRVGKAPVFDLSFNPAARFAQVRLGDRMERLTDPATGTLVPGVTVHKTRRMTLSEVEGPGGPLEILVNNTRYVGVPRPDFKDITTRWNTTYYSELPYEGETEIWEIVNTTVDAHPIHTHLFSFQILNRQAYDPVGYEATYDAAFPGGQYVAGDGPPLDYSCGLGIPPRGVFKNCVLGGNPDIAGFLVGTARPPAPSEAGWKDTVITYPGEVTRLVVRFAPNTLSPHLPSKWASYPFSPDGGHGYVWHCHIIDHEDNEMMRPFSVVPNLAVKRTFVQGVDF
jgi:spore coat protein A, manganese oxidase